MDLKVVIVAVEVGIEGNLYLTTNFRKRNVNLHEFNLYLRELTFEKREKNFIDRSRHKWYVDSHLRATFPPMIINTQNLEVRATGKFFYERFRW